MIRKIVEVTYGNMLDRKYKDKYCSRNNNKLKEIEKLTNELLDEEGDNAPKK